MNAALLSAKHGATVRIPRRAFMLRDDGEVSMAQDEAGKSRGFSMVALTGKAISHWYFGKLAIDVAGVQFKQRLPALLDHDPNQRVGYTTSIAHTKRGLVAEGKMLQRSPSAQVILSDGEDGFPWQASVYLQAATIERVGAGQFAMVNGQKLQGPAAIFRTSTLREVSFTALGADDDTSATPLADKDAGEEVAVQLMDENEERTMTKTTNAGDGEADRAAVAASEAQLKNAADTARSEERSRVTTIRASAAAAQAELADKLIADGTPIDEALLAINEDLRARLTAGAATGAKVPVESKPVGKGNSADVAAKASADAKSDEAELSDVDKWKKEFAGSAKLRDEFTSLDVFLAFKKNEGSCKDYSNASTFASEQGADHNAS
jgi:hypothetical protein